MLSEKQENIQTEQYWIAHPSIWNQHVIKKLVIKRSKEKQRGFHRYFLLFSFLFLSLFNFMILFTYNIITVISKQGD